MLCAILTENYSLTNFERLKVTNQPLHPLCIWVSQDLIGRLLERKPARRLGMLNGRANDIKKHKWFEGLDWEALEARKVAPLRKPKEDSAKRLKELTVSSRAADMLSMLARLPEFQVPSSIINKSQ